MTASNHVITGAIIVAVIPNPIVGLVVAFFSHFLLDVLPHHGDPDHVGSNFKRVLLSDTIIASSVLITLAVLQPANWGLLIAGGIACASPDLMWLPYWIQQLRGKRGDWKNLHPIAKFHSWIQWGERHWGLWIEIPYFLAAVVILERLLTY